MRTRRAWLLSTMGLAVATMLCCAAAASAGRWGVAACENPDGSAASSAGWSSSSGGGTGYGSNNSTSCAPGSPMYAVLSTQAPAPVGAYELLRFTPPPTSTLIGGTIVVALSADGGGYDASGAAVLYTPEFAYDAANVFFQCAAGLAPCANGTNDFTGELELPAGRGGSLFLSASCGGEAGAVCNSGGSEGAWSLVRLYSAILLLENDATPTASGFAGSLLEADAHGTASLRFTASDPDGPGIYAVTVQIDGQNVYQGTPDGNEGRCVSVGNYQSAPVFESLQPCKESETVAIPVDTTGFADGSHELRVSVTDAAGNSSVVYDGQISTANQTTVSALLSSPPSGRLPGQAPRYRIVLSKRTAHLSHSASRDYERSALALAGQLRSASGEPAPGVALTLSQRAGTRRSGAFRLVARTLTNAAGRWHLRVRRGPSRQLRVGYGPDGGESVIVAELVKPSLSLRVRSPHDGRIVFSGTMRIAPLGRPRPLVTIQTRARSGWEAVGLPVRVGAHGHFRYLYGSSPVTLGRRFAFRAVTPATATWQAGRSRVREAVVR